MNKTEASYGLFLSRQKEAGEIQEYHFEAVKLKLAENRCTYTPDFMVIAKDGAVEFHEVKGFWKDDARVKIKVAASIYPFRFIAAKETKFGFEREVFLDGEVNNGKVSTV